jgi:hypothetical protein
MALSLVPFALQNAAHSADIFREAVSSLVPNTGGVVQSGDFPVTQTGTPSMAVQVGVGRAWIKGTEAGDLAGQTYSKQGLYFAFNDAAVTKTVTTANATNPRIDVVYIFVKDQQYSGTSNLVDFAIAAGTPAATPTVPTIPANALALAQVAVAANATSITTANVTGVAYNINIHHAEFVRASQNDQPAGTLWGPGANMIALLDTGPVSQNYSSWVSAGTTNDQLKLQPGVYFIDWKIVNASGAAISLWHTMCTDGTSTANANSTSLGRSYTQNVVPADPYFAYAHVNLSVATDINFKYMCGTAAAPLSQRIKITKIQ